MHRGRDAPIISTIFVFINTCDATRPRSMNCEVRREQGKAVKLVQQPLVKGQEAASPFSLLSEASADRSMKENEEVQLCQVFANAQLSVKDVDEEYDDMPPLCSGFVKGIYKYLHQLEVEQPIRANYMQGYEINARMRAHLIDWMVQVHSMFNLLQETLYLSVAVLARFLQSPTQELYSTYDEAHLKPIMQHMAKNVVKVNGGKTKFQAVRSKYSNSKFMKVSLIPQHKSLLISNMAAALTAP